MILVYARFYILARILIAGCLLSNGMRRLGTGSLSTGRCKHMCTSRMLSFGGRVRMGILGTSSRMARCTGPGGRSCRRRLLGFN